MLLVWIFWSVNWSVTIGRASYLFLDTHTHTLPFVLSGSMGRHWSAGQSSELNLKWWYSEHRVLFQLNLSKLTRWIHKKLNFRKLVVDSPRKSDVRTRRELKKTPSRSWIWTVCSRSGHFPTSKFYLSITLPNSLDFLSSLNWITARRNRISRYVFHAANGTHDGFAYALALALLATS